MISIMMISMRGFTSVPLSSFFELNTDTRTRRHSLKLLKHHCHVEMRRHFFSQRVINRWNRLDQVTVSANNVNRFKSRLERERLQKMGVFMDWRLLGLGAVFNSGAATPVSYLWVWI